MNKIRVIDLLNKIANGEEVPKKIKVGNKIYNYETFNIGKGDNYSTAEWEEVKGYRINYYGTYYYLEIRDYNLNDEVEIIEDTPKVQVEMTQEEYNEYLDKQNEYMEKVRNYKPSPSYLEPKEDKKIKKLKLYEPYPECTDDRFEDIEEKINEIIDRLNGEDNE